MSTATQEEIPYFKKTTLKNQLFQQCIIKQATSQNKQFMVKTVKNGKRETLGQKKNPSGDSQRHKTTIKSPQAQKNLTAHCTFRNSSLHS